MPATALLFEDTYKVPVRHLYGLSETAAVSCLVPRLPDSTRRRLHAEKGFPSVGPALDHIEVRVADPGDVVLPAGERGEIQVRGAVVMSGYTDAPEDTVEAFRNGWFHTGDEGFWDLGPNRQPFFYVTGRLKEIIIRGGVNITPLEVDEVLAQFPGVDHALSFAFEHDAFGEEVAAYIVTRQDIDPAELAAHCLARLDVTRCPKLYVFGSEIPYTATGKAKRLQLRAELSETLQAYRSWRFSRDPAEAVAVRLDAAEAGLTS
jgi:long-chain acyl-CoA synthetase